MNAVLTKTCCECFACLPLSAYPTRKHEGRAHYPESTCLECTRRRWREANKRSRMRRAAGLGPARVRKAKVRKPRAEAWPVPKPFTAKPDPLLDMGWFVTAKPLRWSVGVRV